MSPWIIVAIICSSLVLYAVIAGAIFGLLVRWQWALLDAEGDKQAFAATWPIALPIGAMIWLARRIGARMVVERRQIPRATVRRK